MLKNNPVPTHKIEPIDDMKVYGTIQNQGGHPEFHKLLKEMGDLHSAKDHDYAKGKPLANLRECEKIGISAYKGVLIRMSDKWSRILSLTDSTNEVSDEPIEDTLKDMAVYSLLAIILLREKSNENC
jgi:hypothetical protein